MGPRNLWYTSTYVQSMTKSTSIPITIGAYKTRFTSSFGSDGYAIEYAMAPSGS
jgi:hypothetical protein